MPKNTLTRANLSESICKLIGISKNESSKLVKKVIDEICITLASNESVKISSFGNFLVKQKKERIGRNPKTGIEVPILARKVIVFHASHVLKTKINIRYK